MTCPKASEPALLRTAINGIIVTFMTFPLWSRRYAQGVAPIIVKAAVLADISQRKHCPKPAHT